MKAWMEWTSEVGMTRYLAIAAALLMVGCASDVRENDKDRDGDADTDTDGLGPDKDGAPEA
jgi:hypothetical protein